MRRIVSLILLTAVLWTPCARAQWADYAYERSLDEVHDQWYRVELPPEIFAHAAPDLRDLRVMGVTAAGDTITAPYLLNTLREESEVENLEFRLLNESYNELGYFYTFELPTTTTVNRIELDIGQDNFDWRVRVEGGNDRSEWFTLVEDYRILAVRNATTNFRATAVTFPAARYRYFRLSVAAPERPILRAARLIETRVRSGARYTYAGRTRIKPIRDAEQVSVLVVDFPAPRLVNEVDLTVLDTFDYYRPVTVRYLRDSVKTVDGWRYRYVDCFSGTLSSLTETRLSWPQDIITRQLEITIDNQDNQPLLLGEVATRGYRRELLVRFTEPATYVLRYGRPAARAPQYDLAHFRADLPEITMKLAVGEERRLAVRPAEEVTLPFLANPYWLWGILLVVTALLGWQALQLLRE